jgi:hypothetical protein
MKKKTESVDAKLATSPWKISRPRARDPWGQITKGVHP